MPGGLTEGAERCLELLRVLYHLDITVIRDQEDLDAFSRRHRFHSLQYMFSADSLRQLLRSLEERQVDVLTDVFEVRAALLYLDGIPLILGPFTSVPLTRRDVVERMRQFPLPDVRTEDLLLYRDSLPRLTDMELSHLLASLLEVLCPAAPPREIVRISFHERPQPEPEPLGIEQQNYARLLEIRYTHERGFIEAIQAGNTRKALQELRNMHMDVAYYKRISHPLESERMGAVIVRTTARLAAAQTGLPGVILDKISSDNRLAVLSAQSVEDINRAEDLMVRAYCKEIHNSKSSRHSALVQSALYSIEREFAEDISVQSLAEELDVSVNHLIKVFKSETETTPNAYLRDYRLKQAARLLIATDQPVQEVAAAVGIPDVNYMIKLFRTKYGVTPAVYRKSTRV